MVRLQQYAGIKGLTKIVEIVGSSGSEANRVQNSKKVDYSVWDSESWTLKSMKSSESFVFKISFMISFSFGSLDHITKSFESFNIIISTIYAFSTWGARFTFGILTNFVAILGDKYSVTQLTIPRATIWWVIVDIHARTEFEWRWIVIDQTMQVG